MMEDQKQYDAANIEKRWQTEWLSQGLYTAVDFDGKPRAYVLVEFPYPSGEGLHVGHCLSYIAQDIVARWMRMRGYNVLYPMGWDAFGLPAENFAIKHKVKPQEATKKNIANFKRQIQSLGISFDWSREVNTTDPEYYKWTQWIFLQLFKKGLAEKKEVPINWCPKDKTGLAFEEVIDGKCERCGTQTEKRVIKQWVLKITKYADRLIDDLDTVDYLPEIKQQQINWIGRSEGALIKFEILNSKSETNSKFQTNSKYVILHGYTSGPDEHMFPWLKQELEASGAKVFIPALPSPDDPVVADQVEAVFKSGIVDKDTVLVGHSLGGVVALKLLEKLPFPVKRTILVASYAENRFLNNEPFEAHAFDWKFDAVKIKKNIGELTILRDTTDNIVPADQANTLQKLFGGDIVDFKASTPHAWGAEEPDVLKSCATASDTNSDFLFLHAFRDTSKNAFWPWLKNEVEKRGHAATALDLPNTEKPNIDEQVKYILDNYNFTRSTIVVTHSLGGVAAMKLLPKLQTQIDRLILVSPPLKPEFLDGKERPVLRSATDWKFDFSAIKRNVRFITVVADDHDHIVPRGQMEEIADKLKATFILGHGSETHYDGEIEPYVLNAIFSGINVFTTRPDTLFGATYLVLSPEHELITNYELQITNYVDVKKYIEKAKKRSERERQETKEKTGVELKGIKAINPANKEEIPIWVADYVLSGYGTGAIMAVPAHDERDFEFAKKNRLSIKRVIEPTSKNELYDGNIKPFVPRGGKDNETQADMMKRWRDDVYQRLKEKEVCFIGEGILINSGKFDGMSSEKAREEITKAVDGKMTVQYKLRDWIFSRQHYWGEPIPIIHCEKCGHVPLEEKDLPLELPDVKYYEPTDTGESPLAKISEWVNVKCPNCGGPAKRETDTMPNWAGSSWYFLRYTDPHNDKELADPKKLKYWLPVDLYNGGAEHITLHLLYSRFWHKFLYDIKAVPTSEPYQRRVLHGMILGPDGQKMSKSRGNVINPDDIVTKYGADTFRLYMMFMGEYDQVKIWSDKNLHGVARFIKRLWQYMTTVSIISVSPQEELAIIDRTIVRVGQDFERRSFNTTVSALMVCLNELQKSKTVGRGALERFVRLLAPFTPHLAEEVWHTVLGREASVHLESWPEADPELLKDVAKTIGIQINGKVRAQVEVTGHESEHEVKEKVLALAAVQKHLSGKHVQTFRYIKGKIVSIVAL